MMIYSTLSDMFMFLSHLISFCTGFDSLYHDNLLFSFAYLVLIWVYHSFITDDWILQPCPSLLKILLNLPLVIPTEVWQGRGLRWSSGLMCYNIYMNRSTIVDRATRVRISPKEEFFPIFLRK